MAQLKDLIVNGASRFIGNIFGTNATFSGNVMPETDDTQSLGDSTHKWKFVGALTGNADTATAVKDYNNNTLTKFGYSTSGMTSTSWVGSWDASTSGEYRLRAISPQKLRNSMGLGDTTGALPVANGGTGATTAAGARANLGTLGSKLANGYEGMTDMAGADNVWIRTTSQGIIPYQSGGASAGHCGLGTSTWYFASAYVQNYYGGGANLTNLNASNLASGTVANERLPARLQAYHTSASNDSTESGWYYGTTGSPFTKYHTSNADFMVWTHGYSATWASEIGTDFRSNRIAVRNKNNGTWNSWNELASNDSLVNEFVWSADIYYDAVNNRFTNTRATNAWASQIYSKHGFSTSCYISFRVEDATHYRMIGLNSDPATDANYTSIDYCWYLQSNGNLNIYESGTSINSITNHTTYTAGDDFRIEYSNGYVRYYHNGVLCRIVARAVSGQLYADSSLYNGGTLVDLRFGPIATIENMTGATSSVNGKAGLVPAATSSDWAKFLQGNGTWAYPKEAYLEWGGRNFSGSYGCIDAAMVGELGANRLMFAKAAGITIEYSRDGGSTWTDYGATDVQKVGLFSTGGTFVIGKADSTNKATANGTNYQLRVTLNTGSAQIYTALNKFVLYVSTNGSNSSTVTIQRALQSSPDTYSDIATNVSISGWSGYNVVNVASTTTYGNTAASQYGRIRFIFRANGGSTSYNGLTITKIMGFGGVGWTTPSTMAKTGHLYSFDASQNATFPAKVTATSFSGNLTGNVTGNADTATGANITTNTNGVAYYTNTTGTFGNIRAASGAFYSTGQDVKPTFGTLPTAQGGTGNTSFTQWGVIYANPATKLVSTAAGTAGYPLIGAGSAEPAWYGGQVNTGTAAASWVTSFKGTTNSTSTTTGAVKIAGGLGVDKDIYTARAYATTGMYPSQDNSCEMGSSTLRWKDVYSVNGVFNYLNVNTAAQTTYRARIEGTAYITGVTTHGGNVVSDTHNTDSIGVTGTRWKDGFFSGTLNVGSASSTSTNTTVGSTTVAIGLITVNRAATGSAFTLNAKGVSYGQLQIAAFGTAAVSDGAETPTYTNTVGEALLVLGNSKLGTPGNSRSVVDNARGRLRLYGTGTKYTDLIPAQTGTNGNYTQWLPQMNGNVLVGASTSPVPGSASWTPANWNHYSGTYIPISNLAGQVYYSEASKIAVRLYQAATSNGYAYIYLGNNIAQGTAGNAFGRIYLYTSGTGSTALTGANGSLGGTTRDYLDLGYVKATQVWGAVWNDYAEFRKTEEKIEPGRCIKELGNDSLELTTKRLERGCEIVSDTYGFAIGETEESKTPIASSGRVLAYPYESREEFAAHIGWPVCSGPNGTVSIMTEEEEEKYPSRIIGTISAVPDYEEWGTDKVQVNGRVWIRIR